MQAISKVIIMHPFDKLSAIAETEGIPVEYFDFAPPIKGLYWAEDDLPPIIGLDNSLKRDSRLLTCVFAEELGHHFTTVGQHLPREFYNRSALLYINKIEFKALRWAALHLMPYQELIHALRKGHHDVWDLADYFDVTEDMVTFRLSLLRLKHTSIRSLICRS